jgi:hypothetical protein
MITVCDNSAGEVCPVWPGQPMTGRWGIPDPASVLGSAVEVAMAFNDACRLLYNRLSLLASLPVASLDRLSLKRRLDEIEAQTEAPQEPTLLHHQAGSGCTIQLPTC